MRIVRDAFDFQTRVLAQKFLLFARSAHVLLDNVGSGWPIYCNTSSFLTNVHATTGRS